VIALIGTLGKISTSDLNFHEEFADRDVQSAIEQLISNDLVACEPDNVISGQERFYLSAAGSTLYDQTLPHVRARQAYLPSRLSDDEKRYFFSALEKLERAAEVIDFVEPENSPRQV
jgi:hypothetical protein